jgi:hypothetical protein
MRAGQGIVVSICNNVLYLCLSSTPIQQVHIFLLSYHCTLCPTAQLTPCTTALLRQSVLLAQLHELTDRGALVLE